MIKIENVEVVGWEAAIRGMRNPMNSWDKSDSIFSKHVCSNTVCWTDISLNELPPCNIPEEVHVDNWTGLFYNIGPKDYNLMMKLRNAGTDHRKFMRMIVVYVDITAPLYWWKEFDTYKVGTVANSCSTMHKIHEKEFTLEDFSCEHLISEPYDIDNDDPIDGEFKDDGLVLVSNNSNGWLGHCYHTASGNRCVEYLAPKTLLDKYVISALNACREAYLKTKRDLYLEREKALNMNTSEPMADVEKLQEKQKLYWWQMIQLLPSSYNQKRTVMLNYEVLANIYKSRKNHKLDEWRDFCKWIESLPYSELITGASLKDIPICNEIMEEAKRRVTNGEDKK